MSTRPGLWRRQFLLPPTRAQTVWDFLFGVALPLGCLAGDRILFGRRHDFFDGSIFGPAQVFAYAFILTQVILLGAWILLRRKVTRSAAYFAGPLLAGWLFAFGLGVILFPFSVVGLLAIIGALGFSQWFAGFVFFRNWRMARALAPASSRQRRPWLVIAGIAFAITPALALQARGDYLVRRLVENPLSSRRLEQASRFPLLRTAPLVEAWQSEKDPDRKVALSRAHERLTGQSIEMRSDFFGD